MTTTHRAPGASFVVPPPNAPPKPVDPDMRWEHDRDTDWLPFERFAAVALDDHGVVMVPAEFMWMQCHTVDGVEFHGYRHRNTRRFPPHHCRRHRPPRS